MHSASSRNDVPATFWQEFVAKLAAAAGVNPELAVSVATQESALNPAAVNPSTRATGIMQLLPGTAAEMGVNAANVVENILGGVRYLRQQLTSFGDVSKALAAYNWGPHHVMEAVERHGADWLNAAPSETRNYVASILRRLGSSGHFTAAVRLAQAEHSSTSPDALFAELGTRSIEALGAILSLGLNDAGGAGDPMAATLLLQDSAGLSSLDGAAAAQTDFMRPAAAVAATEFLSAVNPQALARDPRLRAAFSAYLLAELLG